MDVFELISDEKTLPVLYKSYIQTGVWFGKINEIIPSFRGELDSKYLMLDFGVVRRSCKKRCMWKPKSCTICERF